MHNANNSCAAPTGTRTKQGHLLTYIAHQRDTKELWAEPALVASTGMSGAPLAALAALTVTLKAPVMLTTTLVLSVMSAGAGVSELTPVLQAYQHPSQKKQVW